MPKRTYLTEPQSVCVWAHLCQPLVEVQQATDLAVHRWDVKHEAWRQGTFLSHVRRGFQLQIVQFYVAVTSFTGFILFPWFTLWLFGLGPVSRKRHPALLALAFPLLLLLLRSVASIACFPLLKILHLLLWLHLFTFVRIFQCEWHLTRYASCCLFPRCAAERRGAIDLWSLCRLVNTCQVPHKRRLPAVTNFWNKSIFKRNLVLKFRWNAPLFFSVWGTRKKRLANKGGWVAGGGGRWIDSYSLKKCNALGLTSQCWGRGEAAGSSFCSNSVKWFLVN